MESAGILTPPTRDAGVLRVALTDDVSGLAKHCDRIAKSLDTDEVVHAIAQCVSGKPGLLVATNRRLMFVFKPDALTAARLKSTAFGELKAVRAIGSGVVQSIKPGEKWIGYKELRPAIAPEFVRLLWGLGAPTPEGYVEPAAPSELLPSSRPSSLLETLDAEDRNAAGTHIERICGVLAGDEEVRMLSMGVSAVPMVVAITDRRFLWAAYEEESTRLFAVPIKKILSARANHPALLVLGLHSINVPEMAIRDLRPALAEAFVATIRDSGGAEPKLSTKLASSRAPDQTALSVIPQKTARVVQGSIGPAETVFVVLVGGFGQALIALEDRIIIAKAGFMSGNTFGGKVTAFPYREITGIELHTGLSTGVLVIQTPSFPGTQAGSYWASGKNTRPAELPNAIPLPSKGVLKTWQRHLQTLRLGVANGRLVAAQPKLPPELGEPIVINPITPKAPPTVEQQQASPTASLAVTDLGQQLKQISELHAAGALTDEEFAQAKAKLLS